MKNLHELSRKELKQLCNEHKIRTAGVKHDDLVRLLRNKLYPPTADSSRLSAKSRSRVSTDSQPSSKSTSEVAEKSLSRSTSRGPSQRSLAFADDSSRDNTSERSTTELSPSRALPRSPTSTMSNSTPPRRSDFLRTKVNTLSGLGKQSQETRTQQRDGPAEKSRMSVGAQRTGMRNASRAVIQNRETQKSQSNSDAYFKAVSSPRASEGDASATAVDSSDLGSHSSVSEIATDAGHRPMSEDSDNDDGRSVSSEPASRFPSQSNKLTPRRSSGSMLSRGIISSWDSGQELHSSARNNEVCGQDLDNLSTARDEDEIFEPYFVEDVDSLVGDTDGLDSFLDARFADPEDLNRAEITDDSVLIEKSNAVADADIDIAPQLSQNPSHYPDYESTIASVPFPDSGRSTDRLEVSDSAPEVSNDIIGAVEFSEHPPVHLYIEEPEILSGRKLSRDPIDSLPAGQEKICGTFVVSSDSLHTGGQDVQNTEDSDGYGLPEQMRSEAGKARINLTEDCEPLRVQSGSECKTGNHVELAAIGVETYRGEAKEKDGAASSSLRGVAESRDPSQNEISNKSNQLKEAGSIFRNETSKIALNFDLHPPEVYATGGDATCHEHAGSGSYLSIPSEYDTPRLSKALKESGDLLNVSERNIMPFSWGIDKGEAEEKTNVDGLLRIGTPDVSGANYSVNADGERRRSHSLVQATIEGLKEENASDTSTEMEETETWSACEEDPGVPVQTLTLAGEIECSSGLGNQECRISSSEDQDEILHEGKHSLGLKQLPDMAPDNLDGCSPYRAAARSHPRKMGQILSVGLKVIFIIGSITFGFLKYSASRHRLTRNS